MSKEMNINNSIVTFGSNSAIHNASIATNEKDIDWVQLEKDCLELIKKLTNSTKEYQCIEEMLPNVYKKDKQGIISHLKNNKHVFLTSTFSSLASHYFIEFIHLFTT